MAIKSTKKVLASILSLAVFSQPFCGATKNFMENKDDPRKSIVIKKEKPTGFDKIKEFAKKHPVKAAVGGVVGLGTVIIVGGIIVKNAFFDDQNDQNDKNNQNYQNYQNNQNYQNDQENILTKEDLEEGNLNKFEWEGNGVLKIKEGITTIGDRAFYKCENKCENLKEVSIPNSVTTIGVYAFWDCESLEKVNFEEDSKLTKISCGVFGNCKKLNEITIPNSVTTIGDDAFNGCTNLKEVKFEEKSQLKEIGKYAFGNTSLNSVTIPNSVTTIGEDAFCSCTSLNSVTIPNSVKTIDANAFWNTSLKNVTIPSNCGYVKEGRPRSFPEGCVVTPKQMK